MNKANQHAKNAEHVRHAPHAESTDAPVWFITGCSTGFGLELTRQAIERGFRTVVTARDLTKLPVDLASDHVLGLELDVTRPGQVAAAVKAAEARFGSIDVLVNNAGIGYFAAVEKETPTKCARCSTSTCSA